MQLKLYSREEWIGNRHVVIHEMTEGEIALLKIQRVAALLTGLGLGIAGFALTAIFALPLG